MWVKDYMCQWVNTITPDKTVAEAVKQLVEKKTNGMVVVDEENRPVGIISSHIIIKYVVPAYLKDDPSFAKFGAEGTFDIYGEKAKDIKIAEVMHKEFHPLSLNDAMIEAAAYASHDSIRIIPVVDDGGKVVGAITRTCIKNALHNAIFKDSPIDPKKDLPVCKNPEK